MITQKFHLNTAWYSLIVLASVLPAVILSPWLSNKAHHLLLDRAMLQEEIYHKQVETRLSLEVQRLESVLINKADPIAYFLHEKQTHLIQTLMKRIITREAIINTVTIYDRHGNKVLGVKLSGHTPAAIDSDEPAFVIPLHQHTFLGAPSQLADGHYEFLLSAPIISDTQTIAVMVATIRIDDFWKSIKFAVGEHNSRIYLIDGRGSLLNNPIGSSKHQGDLLSNQAVVRALLAHKKWDNPVAYHGFEGDKVFAIASPVEGLPWGLVSEIPAHSLLAPIFAALTTLVLIVFLLHIIFGLLGLFFAKSLLHPITNLANQLRGAASGDYAHQAKASRFIEINTVTEAFNSMVDEIDHREHSLRKMKHAIDHAGESIMITNHQGIIEYVNPTFCRITGYQREEAIGKTPGNLVNSGKQSADFYRTMWHCITSGNKWEGEMINRKMDGSYYPVFANISPIFDADGTITHFIAIERDQSEQLRLEAQLQQAQKMEAIGTLVGGIAHDFNNMIAGITGNLFLAKSKAVEQPDILRHLNNIDHISQNAAEMITQMLTFARKERVEKKDIDLNAFMKEILGLASVTIPENIHFNAHIEVTEPMIIYGDTTQLQQVIMNLLNNARDALHGQSNPLLTLELTMFHADDGFKAKNPSFTNNRWARIRVQDNGHGIPQEALAKLFDPFYTTKEVGKGTGLGLAMCYGAIEGHGGVIQVSSELEQGAIFDVYLPLVDKQEIEDTKRDHFVVTQGSGEWILLADDAMRVRESTAEVLQESGYRVLQANDGEEAFAVFKQHHDQIALAILDVVMPHLSGPALATKLRHQQSDLPIIFITGYDRKSVLKDVESFAHCEVVTKPYQLEQLLQIVQRMVSQNNKGV